MDPWRPELPLQKRVARPQRGAELPSGCCKEAFRTLPASTNLPASSTLPVSSSLRLMLGRFLISVLALILAGCGGTSASTTGAVETTTTTAASTTTATTATTASTAATTTSGATTTSAATELFLIKIEDGAKTEGLDTISVRVGEMVRFEVEADIVDEVHVHGYDLTWGTIPGEAVLVEFVADATGIFEVELEASGLPIVDIEVTP